VVPFTVQSDVTWSASQKGSNLKWCLKARILESERHRVGIHCYTTAC
jgi:hypothetical protein